MESINGKRHSWQLYVDAFSGLLVRPKCICPSKTNSWLRLCDCYDFLQDE